MGILRRAANREPEFAERPIAEDLEASPSGQADDRPQLAVPIYLDVSALLDLLASLEGGFTMVERLATQESHAKEDSQSVAGEFGVGGVLSNLVKINVGGERGRHEISGQDRRVETERYHTYGSLLYRLREILDARDAIRRFDGSGESWNAIQPSDFVELQGVLRPNPFAESVATMLRLIGLVRLTADLGSTADGGGGRQKGQRSQKKEMDLIRHFLEGLLKDVEHEDVNLFVAELGGVEEDGPKAVMALFTEYLRDPSLTELAYGDFKLLGKVVRKLSDDDDEIELLRGTAVGGLGENMLDELLNVFRQLESEGIQLPPISTRIVAPALQVVPVAIYV